MKREGETVRERVCQLRSTSDALETHNAPRRLTGTNIVKIILFVIYVKILSKVGRAGTSYTRGLSPVNCIKENNVKKKRFGMAHLIKEMIDTIFLALNEFVQDKPLLPNSEGVN